MRGLTLLVIIFVVTFGDGTQVSIRYPSELNPADVTYINGKAPEHLKAGPNSKFSAEFRSGQVTGQINTPKFRYLQNSNTNSGYDHNNQNVYADYSVPRTIYNQNEDYKHYVQSYSNPPSVQTISESSSVSPHSQKYQDSGYMGSTLSSTSSSSSSSSESSSQKQSFHQTSTTTSAPVYQTNHAHDKNQLPNIVSSQTKPIVEDTSAGDSFVQQHNPVHFDNNGDSKVIYTHPQFSYQQQFYDFPRFPQQYPIIQNYAPLPRFYQSAGYPINGPVAHNAYQPIQANVKVIGDTQAPQFYQHEGVVQQTYNVPQPFIKTRKYEIRRPAIEKQFFDIEEHVIVRPAGSVIVELDGPVSKIPKGEVIRPIVSETPSHGINVVNQNNENVHYPSHDGIVGSTSAQATSSTAQSVIDSSSSSPIQESHQYADHQDEAALGQLISTPTTTPESIIATTSYPPDLEEEDDSVVVEAGRNLNASIQYTSSTTESSSSTSSTQTNFTTKSTPHMIAVGEPDFSYPPYVEIKSNGARTDVNNQGHDQEQQSSYNSNDGQITTTSIGPNYYTTTPSPPISQHNVFFQRNNQDLVHSQVTGHGNDQYTTYPQSQPLNLIQVQQYPAAEIQTDSIQYQPHRCEQNHAIQYVASDQNIHNQNLISHNGNSPSILQNQYKGVQVHTQPIQQQQQQKPSIQKLGNYEQSRTFDGTTPIIVENPNNYNRAFYQPQNIQNQVVKGSNQGYPPGIIYKEPKYNSAYTQKFVERPNIQGQIYNGQVQKYSSYPQDESSQQLSNYKNAPNTNLNRTYQNQPVLRDDSRNLNIRLPVAHKQIIISSTPSSIPSREQTEQSQNYAIGQPSNDYYEQDRNERSQKLVRGDIPPEYQEPTHFELNERNNNFQTTRQPISQHNSHSPSLQIQYDDNHHNNDNKQHKYANLQIQNDPNQKAQLTLINNNNNNENININQNDNNGIHSRVISSTPAPPNAKPASESVHTRRIVVNHPFETVQEIEIPEPETKQQKLTVNQSNAHIRQPIIG